MNHIKNERAKETIMHAAAEFISEESNRQSLVTVTNIDIRNKGKDVYIMVTVLPEDKAEIALLFLNRKKRAMRDFLKKKISLRVLPFFHFELDYGEKNRQRIDQIIYTEDQKDSPFDE